MTEEEEIEVVEVEVEKKVDEKKDVEGDSRMAEIQRKMLHRTTKVVNVGKKADFEELSSISEMQKKLVRSATDTTFAPRFSSSPAIRSPGGGGRGARPGTARPPLRLGRPGSPGVRMPPPGGPVRGAPWTNVRPLQPPQPSTASVISRLQRISGLTFQTVSQSNSSVAAACAHLESLQRTIQTAAAQVS